MYTTIVGCWILLFVRKNQTLKSILDVSNTMYYLQKFELSHLYLSSEILRISSHARVMQYFSDLIINNLKVHPTVNLQKEIHCKNISFYRVDTKKQIITIVYVCTINLFQNKSIGLRYVLYIFELIKRFNKYQITLVKM